MRGGFWVGSPSRLTTIVQEDVLVAWKSLKLKSPGTSLSAFAGMVHEVGKGYGTVRTLMIRLGVFALFEISFPFFTVTYRVRTLN